jgi:tetratricopeptide (TPR) repeat protein
MEGEAMADLDQTVRLCWGNSERTCLGVLFNALPNRAILYQRLGDYEHALADIDRAEDVRRQAGVTKADPGMAARRGYIYLYKKDYRKAIELLDEALAGEPGATLQLYGRGVAKQRLGRAAEGDADVADAKSRRPDVDVLFARRFGALPE